jgi:hypothetical protein
MSDDKRPEPPRFCYYHPQREAFVSCGSCGKALCVECVQHGPVGTRCIECLYGIEIRPVSRARRIAAGVAALAVAVVIGSLLGRLGWLNWLTGIAMGLLVGHVAKTIAHRIPVPSVQAAAGAAAALGAYSGAVVNYMRILAQVGAPAVSVTRAAANVGLGEWALTALLAAGAAVYWVWRG